MTYHVIIQPNAEAELDAAYVYCQARAPQAAACWFAGLVEAINSLAQFPARCPLAPENEHFAEEIQQLLYGTRRDVFRILFTIRRDTVHVLHIRHGAQQHLRQECNTLQDSVTGRLGRIVVQAMQAQGGLQHWRLFVFPTNTASYWRHFPGHGDNSI